MKTRKANVALSDAEALQSRAKEATASMSREVSTFPVTAATTDERSMMELTETVVVIEVLPADTQTDVS